MAAETLPGGNDAQDALPEQLFNKVEGLFSNAQGGTAQQVGVGSTSLIVAKGPNNEDKALLIPPTADSTLVLDSLGIVVTVPANVGLTFEGTQTTNIVGAGNFLSDQATQKIGQAHTDLTNSGLTGAEFDAYFAALNAISTSVDKGIQFLLANASDTIQVSKVNLINVLDNSTTSGSDINLNLDNADGSGLSAVNLGNVKAGNTVVIENADKLLIVGTGTVKIADGVNASVAGDSRAQAIVGGSGNDTLVGGGGADTLAGGAGNNTFGLTATSQMTILDFDTSKDKLLITLPGVTDFEALKAAVTDAQYVNGNSTFTLSDGSVITLVGVDPNTITSDLFQFSV